MQNYNLEFRREEVCALTTAVITLMGSVLSLLYMESHSSVILISPKKTSQAQTQKKEQRQRPGCTEKWISTESCDNTILYGLPASSSKYLKFT